MSAEGRPRLGNVLDRARRPSRRCRGVAVNNADTFFCVDLRAPTERPFGPNTQAPPATR
jgi:hypothetical protein